MGGRGTDVAREAASLVLPDDDFASSIVQSVRMGRQIFDYLQKAMTYIVANLLFMPIFAGLRRVPLAAVDIVIVWATIIRCGVAVWPHHKWVALAQVPYFMSMSSATGLNCRSRR